MVQLVLLTLFPGLAVPVGALLALIENLRPGWLEREVRHTIIAFGGGVLLAAVALVLVPEGAARVSIPLAALYFVAGGVVFMLIDRACARAGGSKAQLIAMLADFVPESVALGATFAVDHGTGVLLAILIATQNLPEGFNACRELRASGAHSKKKILISFALMALLGPVFGVLGFYFLQDAPGLLGALMLGAAGGILYLTFEDIAPQARLENSRVPALGAVLGFLLGLVGQMLVEGM